MKSKIYIVAVTFGICLIIDLVILSPLFIIADIYVDDYISDMNASLDSIDESLDSLDQSLNSLDQKLRNMEESLDDIDQHITNLNQGLENINNM